MPEFAGEWWIIGNEVVFADGDVGDMNHVAHVVHSISVELLDAVNEKCPAVSALVAQHVNVDGHMDCVALRCGLCDWADMAQRSGQLTDEEADDIHSWLRQKIGWPADKYALLFDDNADPRAWAIQHLGWIRVARDKVEAWRLDRTVLRQIADGLCEAYPETAEGGYFDLEDKSRGWFFMGVPFLVIENGHLAALRNWKNHAFGR